MIFFENHQEAMMELFKFTPLPAELGRVCLFVEG
jgi:hypothetical protein